ncbi:MAG TPA: ABC transporter permease subunit [Acidimicrobiales bacterium]|nr:ABC transporter permease subunit [Acidimicrobiales bacterium]
MSKRRVGAILHKEFREYRRNGNIIATMAVIPLVIVIAPLIDMSTTALSTLQSGRLMIYLLGIAAIVPAIVAAYSVVGERQQGTLEPVLTTPIRREELVLAKALAILLPSLAISYAWYGLYVAWVELLARPGVPQAIVRGPELFALVLFTPLVAALSIWIGIAISTRMNDIRAAAQLGALASLPTVLVSALIAYNVIHVTLGLTLGLAAVLLGLDTVGWRISSAMFDRERLVTGTKA